MTTTASFPASYPLGALVERPPEWALNLMADLYAAEIKGSHGFQDVRHPRARWLTLLVTNTEECFSCFDTARWAEDLHTAFCPRCAEAEVALNAAERLRDRAVPRHVPAYETEPTKVEPFVRDADLPRPAALTLLCAVVLAALSMASGCATSRPVAVAAPETVGKLAPSYASIATAPVHATTDFGTPQVVDTDEDAPGPTITAPAADVEAPEIAPKTDGVTTGPVRK